MPNGALFLSGTPLDRRLEDGQWLAAASDDVSLPAEVAPVELSVTIDRGAASGKLVSPLPLEATGALTGPIAGIDPANNQAIVTLRRAEVCGLLLEQPAP